jgi:GT2 family glycosyltransferase
MRLAIVILNWNGVKLLKKFLKPLVTYTSTENEIYVIDNKSTDNSIDYIKSNFPNIKIIKNNGNYGYAKGYNEGLKKINADIFCLLNNDVEVSQNWIKPVMNEFRSNPITAAVQPKILNYKNKDYFDYAGAAGGFIDSLGYPYCDGRIHNIIEKDKKQYDYNKDIFWASGACLFIRKDIFIKLNGFDESFFNHMEEIDLCWRILKSGLKIKYIYNSKVFHVGGGTLDYNNPKKTFYNFRNSLFTITKNSEKNLFTTLFFKMIVDGLIGISFLLTFKFIHLLAIIKAHFAFYGQIPRLIKQRQRSDFKLNGFESTFLITKYFKLKFVKFFSN